MYLWIDPPGIDPGWIHELAGDDEVAQVVAGYPIPDDNADRIRAHDELHEGASAELYQAERDFWGVTVLSELPTDLPDGIRLEPRP